MMFVPSSILRACVAKALREVAGAVSADAFGSNAVIGTVTVRVYGSAGQRLAELSYQI